MKRGIAPAEAGRRASRRAPTLWAALLCVACSAGSGTSSGGGPGIGDPGPLLGEDGGQLSPPAAPGSVVAVLETQLPWLDEFMLRGTFPVPPGTFPRADGKVPFAIVDYDGTTVKTQTNVVTRYANSADGADVVEVVGRVRKDPTLSYGSWTQYEVKHEINFQAADPGSPGVEDLRKAAKTQAVLDLLADPSSIELRAYDVFGNAYVARPLDGSGWKELERYGWLHTELKVYQEMQPETPVTGPTATLPHMFGVHAYVSTLEDEDFVLLDLRFHNGHSGRDQADPLDDPLGKLYFERIDIVVPDTFWVDQAFADPFFGYDTVAGGKRTVAIVNRDWDGTMHVMPWQGQMVRRLALSTNGQRAVAGQYLSGSAGQAFCSRGFAGDGREYWSWWNKGTSRYFPQKYQLPRLDHVGLTTLRAEEAARHDELVDHLEYGTNTDSNYPIPSGNLGWAHPYGTPYGGMTSGNEIFLYDGVVTLAAKSRLGLQRYKALHRMHTDRMPDALYDRDGTPSTAEDWLVDGRYVPFEFFLHPSFTFGDPFGVLSAPTDQADEVVRTGRVPWYEAALLSFEAHDYQHFIRYTRSAKVLTWLANDAMAKDDLAMQSEVFRLAYHSYANNEYGGSQGSGMRADQGFVQEFPGRGFTFGRGEAWGVDCAVAAYAAADDAWRERTYPWFEALAKLLSDGQGSCTGFIQATISPKNLNGKYRTRQQIEQSITENMLQGLRETVFRGRSAAHSDLLRDVLAHSLHGFVSELVFIRGASVPPAITAVGPLDVRKGIYCSPSSLSKNTWSSDRERYQIWSSFAYGYELTARQDFLDRAHGATGSPGSLFVHLMAAGVENVENRAALLALVQRLQGLL